VLSKAGQQAVGQPVQHVSSSAASGCTGPAQPLLLTVMHADTQLVPRRLQVGADLCMGSLIKSPGGTLATTGGYIAGRGELVAAAGARLTAPGVGLDAGAVPSETLRLMYQGRVPSLSRRLHRCSLGVALLSSMSCAFGAA
jgi:Methionine gamma-lyase